MVASCAVVGEHERQGAAPSPHCATGDRPLSMPARRGRDNPPMPDTTLELVLRGEHIALDALLKATGLAPSGGFARQLITEGEVRVDGQVELRKTAKIRAGQTVELAGHRVMITAGPPQGDRSPSGGPTP
jgi:ribosome-associated protein